MHQSTRDLADPCCQHGFFTFLDWVSIYLKVCNHLFPFFHFCLFCFLVLWLFGFSNYNFKLETPLLLFFLALSQSSPLSLSTGRFKLHFTSFDFNSFLYEHILYLNALPYLLPEQWLYFHEKRYHLHRWEHPICFLLPPHMFILRDVLSEAIVDDFYKSSL